MSSAISASADAFVAVCPELCTLLENEYFLQKVLEHVVDDGLHECSRVCRKWYDVCRRLPVKLKVKEIVDLQWVCELFPNATSVSTPATPDNHDGIIDGLGSLRQLRHLDIELRGETESMSLSSFPQLFKRLESLSLQFSVEGSSVDLGSSLQFLTNVTKLELIMPLYGDTQLQMEPVTQLSKLRNLSLVATPIATLEGQLLFQPLTGLTSLSLSSGHQFFGHNKQTLEMIHGAAMHLQRLTLQLWDTYLWEDREWTTLSTFSNLESVAIGPSKPALRKVLTSMSRLTELDMQCEYGRHDEDWDSVLSLSGLRSLCFLGRVWILEEEPFVLHSLHRLPLLTRLTTDFAISGAILNCLTNLVELTFHIEQCPVNEIQAALVRLTNLESLELSSPLEICVRIESTAFAQLKKLRRLSLTDISLDKDFLLTLRDLPELMCLYFSGPMMPDCVPSFFAQLTLLSNLRTLIFDFKGPDGDYIDVKPCPLFPEGSLPRLRELGLCGECTQDEFLEIFRRLPSLRQFDI